MTLYTVPEDKTTIELSVVIFDPPRGGAPRPFTLSFSTADGSASRFNLVCVLTVFNKDAGIKATFDYILSIIQCLLLITMV